MWRKSKTMIEAVVQIPLESVQTGTAKTESPNPGHCIICGKKIKDLDNAKRVHLLTNGNIISSAEDFDNSQGVFEVGPECAKNLIIKFAF